MDIIEILGKITMTEWIIRLIGAGLIVGSLFAFLGIRRRSKIVSGFLSAGALSREEAKTLTVEAGESVLFLEKGADFSGLYSVKGLESLIIEKSNLNAEQASEIKQECEKRGIECRIETGE